MSRVAAIDCGTNSIRLLIADVGTDGALAEVERRTEIVRLGQGVDATGEFHPDALARTFAATDTYAELIRAAAVPPERIGFVATSAARDARNSDAFFGGIEQRIGRSPQVISGRREAELSFTGAISGVAAGPEPVLVVDIGGGSTELIIGRRDGTIVESTSLDIGSVRITERFLGAGPPDPADLGRAATYVDEQLDRSGIELAGAPAWIGVAGTATTLAAVHLGLRAYDRRLVHGAEVTVDALSALLADLAARTVEQIRAIASMHPGRADVICGGTLIATRIGRRTAASAMVVSESDILDGIALALAAGADLAECRS